MEDKKITVPDTASQPGVDLSVDPVIMHLDTRFTIHRDGMPYPYEITSGAKSVRELWGLIFPGAGNTTVVERTSDGRSCVFPEAIVRVVDAHGNPCIDIVAGWAPLDDEDAPDGDDDEDDEDDRPRKKRRPF